MAHGIASGAGSIAAGGSAKGFVAQKLPHWLEACTAYHDMIRTTALLEKYRLCAIPGEAEGCAMK